MSALPGISNFQIAFKNGDYGLGPTGLLGNEDLGQMSAWFLFSSLGFYPGASLAEVVVCAFD